MIWLSTSEVAFLLQASDRTIRRNIKQYAYKVDLKKGGYKGKCYLIALESLPQYAQDKYLGNESDKVNYFLSTYTGKQQEEANFKMRIVQLYIYSGLPPAAFIEDFNNNNTDDTISISQLYRWHRKLKESGFDVCSLVDTRGKYNKGKSSITAESWDYFLNLYMNENKPTIQRCYEFTCKKFEDVPSVKAFERKLKTVPELVFKRYREGEKAFNDSLPSMIRSRLDIDSNDIWFSDHHLIDVAIKNKYGKVVRPWLTVFYDAKSNKVISFILRDKSADSTVIKECLKNGITTNGVPKELYFDNGKDYREKSFNKDFPAALVNRLGIKMIYATPYHGQAKTVERWFRTLEDRFCKFFITYLGRDAKQRPEKMRKPFKDLESIAPDIEDFKLKLAEYIDEYNNTPNKGQDMNNKTPNEVYLENLKNKIELRDTNDLNIICGTFEIRSVGKNGIQYENRQYYSEELIKYQGEKVYINYSPNNLDELNIFTMDMTYICLAKTKLITAFRHTTKEDIKEAKKEQKKARKLVEAYLPIRELDTMEIVSNNQACEKANKATTEKVYTDAVYTNEAKKATSKKVKPDRMAEIEAKDREIKERRKKLSTIVDSFLSQNPIENTKYGGFI